MKNDIVARYQLKFKDLASKKLLRVAAAARVVSKAMKVAALASVALGAVGVAAAVRYANAWAKTTDELGKASKRIGVTAGALQKMQTAMELQGGTAEDVIKGYDTLNKRVGELRMGQGAMFTALKKNNPALLEQFQNVKNSAEAMDLATQHLATLTNAQDRAAFSALFFGRQAGQAFDNMTKDGVKSLQQLMAEAARLRPPLTKKQTDIAAAFNDQMLKAVTAMRSLGDTGSSALLPMLTKAAHAFTEFVASNRDLISSKIESTIKAIGDAIKKIDWEKTGETLKGFGAGLLAVSAVAQKFIEFIGAENAVKLFVASMVVGKIAPFVAMIGTLGKGVMFAWPYLLKFGGAIKLLGTMVLTAGKALIPLLMSIGLVPIAIALAAAAIAAGIYWIVTNFDTVKAKALEMGIDLDAVGANIVAGFQWLKGMAIAIWDGIKFAMTDPMGAAKAVIVGYVTGLQSIWTTVMGAIANVASNIWEGIKNTFKSGVDYIKNLVNGLADSVGLGKVFDGVSSPKSGAPRQIERATQSAKSASTSRSQVASAFSGKPLDGTVWIKTEKGVEVSRAENATVDNGSKGANFSLAAAA